MLYVQCMLHMDDQYGNVWMVSKLISMFIFKSDGMD
jgi:hypothetical protein